MHIVLFSNVSYRNVSSQFSCCRNYGEEVTYCGFYVLEKVCARKSELVLNAKK